MTMLRRPYYMAAACLAAGGLLAAPAFAQLGSLERAAESSSEAVVHYAQGDAPSYVETIDTHGIAVREYVDTNDMVYAVSWRGPAMPDIEALLGAYFQRFKDGASAAPDDAGLHATRIADGALVVEHQVRLREFSGRAWLVGALPAGVSSADIQ